MQSRLLLVSVSLLLSLFLLLPAPALAAHCEQPYPMPDWMVGRFRTLWPDGSVMSLQSTRMAGSFLWPNGTVASSYIMRAPLEYKKGPVSFFQFRDCVHLASNPTFIVAECLLMVPTKLGWNATFFADPAKLKECAPAPGAPGTALVVATRIHDSE